MLSKINRIRAKKLKQKLKSPKKVATQGLKLQIEDKQQKGQRN